jgi:hypothetical protein
VDPPGDGGTVTSGDGQVPHVPSQAQSTWMSDAPLSSGEWQGG